MLWCATILCKSFVRANNYFRSFPEILTVEKTDKETEDFEGGHFDFWYVYRHLRSRDDTFFWKDVVSRIFRCSEHNFHFPQSLYFNLLSANSTKCSNTLKQFVGNLPTNCFSVFDHFVKLALKGLTNCTVIVPYGTFLSWFRVHLFQSMIFYELREINISKLTHIQCHIFADPREREFKAENDSFLLNLPWFFLIPWDWYAERVYELAQI